MPIYLPTTAMGAAYYGADPLAKIYYGADLVWEKGGGGSDPYWANVSFLCGYDVTDVSVWARDESSNNFAHVLSGQNAYRDSVAGGVFDRCLWSNADFGIGLVRYANNSAFAFGAGAFTVETFVQFNLAPTTGFHYFMALYDTGANKRAWALGVNAGRLFLFATANGSLLNEVAGVSWAPSTGVWYHVAADFDGTKYRVYVDGVMVASGTSVVTIAASTAQFTVGAALNNGDSNGGFKGWLDEVRVTKGVARYASDSGFTVPTAKFPRG